MNRSQKEYLVMMIIVATIAIGLPLTLMYTAGEGPNYHCVKYEKDT